jgi:hypothetical protein
VSLLRSWAHGASATAVSATRCTLVVDQTILSGAAASGLYIEGSTYTVTNTIVSGNGSAPASASVAIYTSTGTFRHNTVVANVSSAVGAGISCDTPTTPIGNSIIWGNSKYLGSQISGCALTYVDIDDTTLPLGAGNRSITPSFTSDYHLAGHSGANDACCIDQIAASSVGHDIDGRARPQGPKYDIGAHEVP